MTHYKPSAELKRKVVMGGLSASEAEATLLELTRDVMTQSAGYVPDVMLLDEPIPQFDRPLDANTNEEAVTAMQQIILRYKGIVVKTSAILHDGTKATYDEAEDKLAQLYSMIADATPYQIPREYLYRYYNLPLLRKHMTIEQKRIAHDIEELMKFDACLRPNQQYCVFSGCITDISPERKVRNKELSHKKQAEMNQLYAKLVNKNKTLTPVRDGDE